MNITNEVVNSVAKLLIPIGDNVQPKDYGTEIAKYIEDSSGSYFPDGVNHNLFDYISDNKTKNDIYHGYVGDWESLSENFDSNKYSISEAIINLKATTNDIEDNVNNLTNRTEGLEGMSSNFGSRGNYETVYTEIGKLYTKIDAEKSNLQAEITKEKSNLQDEISAVNTSLQNSITSNVTTLNTSIANISDKHASDYGSLNSVIGTQPEENPANIFTRLANVDTAVSKCAIETEVEETYATKDEVKNTYITKDKAKDTYAAIETVNSSFEAMQEDINTRIKTDIADERFLSKVDAATTYDIKGTAQEVKTALSGEIDNL